MGAGCDVGFGDTIRCLFWLDNFPSIISQEELRYLFLICSALVAVTKGQKGQDLTVFIMGAYAN